VPERNTGQPNPAEEKRVPEATGMEPAAESTQPDPQSELQQLREELDEVKDHALRCAAELDNYRKRAAREMSEERRYANIGLLRDLLPVLDNIHRAIESAEKSNDAAGLLQGVQLVGQQLDTLLGRHHCHRIEALGKPFDPSFHQAIAQQPSAEVPANSVMYEALPGYRLHDRVVRASQVVVSSGPTPDAGA